MFAQHTRASHNLNLLRAAFHLLTYGPRTLLLTLGFRRCGPKREEPPEFAEGSCAPAPAGSPELRVAWSQLALQGDLIAGPRKEVPLAPRNLLHLFNPNGQWDQICGDSAVVV